MRLTLEATQYRGLNYEIHESDGDGLIKLHVFRNDPLAEATTIIDITKQFSMIEEIAESQGNPPYRETCKVEMEYIEPAGIWFPRRALLERYEGKPLVKTGTKTFEFTNTQLNIPIPDEEFHIKLPTGTRLTDTFAQETYTTRFPLTLSQIVSGEAWKLHSASQQPTGAATDAAPRDYPKVRLKTPLLPAILLYGGAGALLLGILGFFLLRGGRE